MGVRGPRPTPKTILKLRGSWRAKRGGEEPAFPPGAPTCPRHLKGEARKEWRRILPELEAAGLVARVDRAALAAYCQAWARWVEAEDKLALSGAVLKSENNGLYLNPYLAVANRALEQMRQFLTEFGFSPAARARVSAPGRMQEEDPFDTLLRGTPAAG